MLKETYMSKRKSGLKLSAFGPEDGANVLINTAISMGVHNAKKLIADGYPGRQFSVALAEINRAQDERFSRLMSLELQKVSQLIGDPLLNGMTDGRWGSEETRYLNRLRDRIIRARAKTKASAPSETASQSSAAPERTAAAA
jgi:hypothetical protein